VYTKNCKKTWPGEICQLRGDSIKHTRWFGGPQTDNKLPFNWSDRVTANEKKKKKKKKKYV